MRLSTILAVEILDFLRKLARRPTFTFEGFNAHREAIIQYRGDNSLMTDANFEPSKKRLALRRLFWHLTLPFPERAIIS